MSSLEICVKCCAPATLMCGRCFERYCSVKCQMQDWVTHKRECKEIPRLTPINGGPKTSQNGSNVVSNGIQKAITPQALLEAIQVLTNKFELASKTSLQVSGLEQNIQEKQNDFPKSILTQKVNDNRVNEQENQAQKNSSAAMADLPKSRTFSEVVSKRFYTKYIEILPLPIGKNKKLFVTDTSSIANFIITVIDAEHHKEMVKNLEIVSEFCKNAPKSKLGYRPQAKELCLAMFDKDGKWYRACLMSENDDLYTLYSIDCGKLAQVPRERIMPFNDKLMFSTSANVCHIKNVKLEGLPKLKALIAKDAHIDCHVRYVEDQRTYEIKVNEIDTTLRSAPITQQIQKQEKIVTERNEKDLKKQNELAPTVEKTTVPQKQMQSNAEIITKTKVEITNSSNNVVPPSKKFSYKDLQVIHLSVGSNLKLAVTDASLIDHFLLTVIECESKYCKKFTNDLLKVGEYCKNVEKTKQNYCPQTNEMCLAIFEGDGQWYRAFFSAETPIDHNYKLTFVDFGNTSLVPSSNIIQIPKELMFPTCANICHIKNIEKDDLPKLKEFLAKQNVIECDIRYVESMDIFQININEWETMTAKSALEKQQSDIQVSVADFEKVNVEKTKIEAPTKKLNPLMNVLKKKEIENEAQSTKKFFYENLQVFSLTEGKNCKLIVTDSSFIENFILSVIEFASEHTNKMAADMKKIGKYCKKVVDSKRGYNPEPNEICLAIFDEDGEWYRACCIEENSTAGTYKVQFIDYGNVANVTREHLMPITEELMFPTCTNVCRIQSIEANDLQKLKDFLANESLMDCDVCYDDTIQMYAIKINAVF